MQIKQAIDLVDCQRILKAYLRYGDHFLCKFMSDKELSVFQSIFQPASKQNQFSTRERVALANYLGARWAGKEAILKVLGLGFNALLSPCEFSILKNSKGEPYVLLSKKAQNYCRRKDLVNWSISLSHEKDFAIASVLAYSSK